jgi:hypothetical protein
MDDTSTNDNQIAVPFHMWEPDFSEGEPPTDSKVCGLCGREHERDTYAPPSPAAPSVEHYLRKSHGRYHCSCGDPNCVTYTHPPCHIQPGDTVKFKPVRDKRGYVVEYVHGGPRDRAVVKAVEWSERCQSGWMVTVWVIVAGYPQGYPKLEEWLDSGWLERVPAGTEGV